MSWIPDAPEADAPSTTSSEIEGGLFNLAISLVSTYRSEGFTAKQSSIKLIAVLDQLRSAVAVDE